jgi:hypothetical protein
MKVVLDTTVFENGFNARSAEVPLIKSFLIRTKSELCIPSIVHEEALNRLRKRMTEANSKIDSVHRLTGGVEGFEKIRLDDALRIYAEALKGLFGDLKARVLPYPVASHEELVKRSLVAKKPFVESGRGYRDALVWHSLLELLRSTSEDIVFVSQNSNDWCGDRKDALHPDFVGELRDQGLAPERLTLLPALAEFNRRYTVSSLPIEKEPVGVEEVPIDYSQLLIDGEELIETHLLVALPDLLRRENLSTLGEVGVIGISSPANVRNEPPRMLDAERRLLQFGADYRLAVDLVVLGSEISEGQKRVHLALVSLRPEWGGGWVRLCATLPVRASFHMIQRGENTEQFSLASVEIIEA